MSKGLFDCTGKVTLVTGGNGGIGFGYAMGVAKMGGDIAIWARNAEKNAAAKAELEAAGAGKVITYQVDVSDHQAIIDGYATLKADFGRLDCVFANSGRSAPTHSVFDIDETEWRDFLALGLDGAFWTLQEGARLMVERAKAGEPGGSLVACGSLSLFQGIPGKQTYAGSKGALGSIIRCLAVELGQYNIRANIIAPGLIMTPMMGSHKSVLEERFAPTVPIKRVGYPEDFEGIGAYLTSDASSFMTGETITIDGGYMVRP
ncbi:MAG TPA: SDR family oxidoreductase [Sphingobium sp.]